MQVPLTTLISPALLPEPVAALVELVEVIDYELDLESDPARVSIAIRPSDGTDPRIPLGGPGGFSLVFASLGTLELELGSELGLTFGLDELRVELPTALTRAREVNGAWVADSANPRQAVVLKSAHGPLGLRWHSASGFGFVWPEDPSGVVDIPVVALTETLVADTRIVVSARGVDVVPGPDDFRLQILEAQLLFPAELAVAPDLKFTDVRIDRHGFTGRAQAAWNDLGFDATTGNLTGSVVGELFGWQGGLNSVLLEFRDTQAIAAEIKGKLVVPYFERPADVRVNLGEGGVYTVTLDAGAEGELTLTRAELLQLRMRSLSLARDAGGASAISLSGGLTPMLMASEGLEWPAFDVTDVRIDSTGKFTIAEAWLDLKDLATLDLWGFHFELRRVGLGYEEPRDRLWLDLSGGLRLIEAVPLGVDVEGFRLNWPRLLLDGVAPPLSIDQIQRISEQIEVSFDGVHLFYGIPETVEFEGLIRFVKTAQSVAFAGDIALRVPAAGFAAEAGLLIGMNLGSPPFPFLYVYFGVDLPAGIPLAQSGLALKGAQGLFGINVAPDKTPEQNWYHDWYKRGPIVGAHPTNKWRDERDALAVGIGVTITTVDGFVKGTRGLLVVALPGPVVILEGRALLLEGLAPGEPPLRALAVFDGREKTAQLNIDAQAQLVKDTLEAAGVVEAFFDFEDLSNWHLYFGQDAPTDRRVRANVLDLLRADSYLMLDSGGGTAMRARMGAAAEFAPEIPDFGPVSVRADLHLDGDGALSLGPEQLSGDVGLDAEVELSAFGFAMRLSASARVLLEGPRPFKVEAELAVEADLPDPLPDFEASFPFSWQAPQLEVPQIASPVSAASLVSRFASSSVGLAVGSMPADAAAAAQASPVVPLDAGPVVEFRPEVNQPEGAPLLRHPGGPKAFDVGPMRFTPTVERVELAEHRKDRPWTDSEQDWTLVASTAAGGDARWSGVWLADADPLGDGTPSARRLYLGSGNPLLHLAGAPPRGNAFLLGERDDAPSAADAVLVDYPDLMTCTDAQERPVCIRFDPLGPEPIPPGREVRIDDVRLTSRNRLRPERQGAETCLAVDGYLEVRFPAPVARLVVRLCKAPASPNADIATLSTAQRAPRTRTELGEARDAAREAGDPFDPRECRIGVPLAVTSSPDEWVLEAAEGFSCLSIVRMGEFSVGELCFVTVEERRRARRTAAQCRDNQGAFPELHTLRPGRYYRLRVQTSVAGELRLAGLPFPVGSPLAGIASELYEATLTALGLFDAATTFEDVAFMQTDGPPVRLAPYVHSTHPAPEAERVFGEDDFAIRMRRGYLSAMFPREAFELELVIRGSDGCLLSAPDRVTDWSAAASATRFPDEEAWDGHRREHAISGPAPAPDQVLELRRRAGADGLSPSSRNELLLTGGAGGALLDAAWDEAAGWTVANGSWVRGHAVQDLLLGGRAEWADVDCSFDYLPGAGGTMGLLVRVQEHDAAGTMFAAEAVRVLLPTPSSPRLAIETVTRAGPAGAWQPLALETANVAVPDARPIRARVQLLGSRLRVWVFEQRVAEVTVAGHPFVGRLGLTTSSPRAEFHNVEVRDSVLHRVRFVTSRFARFRDLIDSYADPGPDRAFTVQATGTPPTPDLVLASQRAWARREWDWHRAQVDHRDGLLRGGRAELEAQRTRLRAARAGHAAAVREWAAQVAPLDGQAQTPSLEVHLVSTASGVVAVWLRSPETLAVQHAVRENPEADGGAVVGHIGRTRLALTRTQGTFPQRFRLVSDPGSQQILLVTPTAAPWAAGTYQLAFTYQRDMGDELTSAPHRYDRCVERRQGERSPETANISWEVV